MIATTTPTATRARSTRKAPVRGIAPKVYLTRGEVAFLRLASTCPSVPSDDVVVGEPEGLVAPLGRPRIAARLARAGLTRTWLYRLPEDPGPMAVVNLTAAGWRSLDTGRRPAGPA